MNNIYEKLEIRDYESFDTFVKELNDGYKRNKETYDGILEECGIFVYGDYDFIFYVMNKLVNEYGYSTQYIYMDKQVDTTYSLEVYDNNIVIEEIYYNSMGIGTNKKDIKIYSFGYDYSIAYIYQDGVKQDIVDYCLKTMDKPILFGIDCGE